MSPSESLSETEQLILSYLGSNPPEECMLDKIAMGIGKSRATVLKYLQALHARGILDHRVIGRNKHWMIKQPRVLDAPAYGTEPLNDTRALASRAFEMHAALLRRAELETLLATPETIIFTILKDTTIVFKNPLAESLFPGVLTFQELMNPGQAAHLQMKLRAGNDGSPVSLELTLKEQTGVLRRYLVTFVFPNPGEPSGCIAVVGEDLACRQRSKRDFASLLYVIRTAGVTRTEEDLLRVAMKGIRERLVPYRFGAVFLEEMRMAYSTRAIPESEVLQFLPLVNRCRDSLTTVAIGKDDRAFPILQSLAGVPGPAGAVAVPIIEAEQAVGALLLIPDTEISTTDLGNVEIVADEISSVLRMQHLDRERNEYINTLLALNRLSGILNEERDEEALLSQAIESVMDSLGFEMGCVYLKDEKDDMIPRVQKNMPESLRKMCVSGIFNTLFERAFAEKTVLYLTPDVPEYAGLDPAIRRSHVRTLLIIPIRIGDTVEGLLNMGSRMEKQYLPVSLENIVSLGLQLGTALERSRFARALENRNREDTEH
ncbi:GAF domain-containing protein [Methanosphaerula subterraneus]|uniref:GAF domain-containing protein n=1 Tax=Methanosphaerula subterraneus TaxID=3350244 RepID=UPI003F85796C